MSRVKYEVPVIIPEKIRQYLVKKLWIEWYQEEGDWKDMVEENERVLYEIKWSDWSLRVVPLASLFLDPLITNYPAFKESLDKRMTYQRGRIDKGVAIEPVVTMWNGFLHDGYHRVMVLRDMGEEFVLAYVGREPD